MFFGRVDGDVLERDAVPSRRLRRLLRRVGGARGEAGEHVGKAAEKQKHLREMATADR